MRQNNFEALSSSMTPDDKRYELVDIPGLSNWMDNNTDEDDPVPIADDFETMVSDIRRPFIAWLKKTEIDLRRLKANLDKRKKKLAEDKVKLYNELMTERQTAYESLKEERRKMKIELNIQMKQISVERQESRDRILEEKLKFEAEKENKRRGLLMEQEKLRLDMERYQTEKQRILDCKIATETMVDLNVGGVVFETSRHTVTQQQGSFLEGIFSGRHSISRDRNGRVFLDRDSELFRIILAFLRSPLSPPSPRDLVESDALANEADYFGIKFFPFPLVYAFGGHDGSDHLRTIELLDIGRQCWRFCSAMNTERSYFGGGSLLNRIYVYGGQNLDYKALRETEFYDCLRDVWCIGTPMNIARRNPASCVAQNKLFCIGGYDGTNIVSSVESYDPRSKGWSIESPMGTPRSSAVAIESNGRIVVCGGTRGERLRTVEVYDLRMNKWDDLGFSMLEERSAGSGCGVRGNIYVMGGTNNLHETHSSVEMLEPQQSNWQYVKSMTNKRMDCSCVSISDCSFLVGGGQSGAVYDSTEIFRPEINDWQLGPPMLSPRYGHLYLVAAI